MNQKVFGFGVFTLAVFAAYGAGCSSSSTTTITGDQDSGSQTRLDSGGATGGDGGSATADDAVKKCIDVPQRIPYAPPFEAAQACTAEQIAEFAQNCFASGDIEKCKAFASNTANDACRKGCLVKFAEGETNYGPVLPLGNGFFNEAGYFEINGVSEDCVKATWDVFSCVAFSCDPCIDDPDPQTYDRCLAYAQNPNGDSKCVEHLTNETNACSSEVTKVNALRKDLDNNQGIIKLLTAFCGGT